MSAGRIEARFEALAAEGRSALITFITAGDPDLETCFEILKGLPAAGADLIELGMPFSDPMADGPAIQAASRRALKSGITLKKVLKLVEKFRKTDSDTPIILMGYFNPVYNFGAERFVNEAKRAGVDGLIVVDVPPEADDELCLPALAAGLRFIRLLAPTTDEKRLPQVLKNTSGFLYYIAVTGVTGGKSADEADIRAALLRIRRHTNLPVVAGFGVKTAAQAEAVAGSADGVVVGSAIVNKLAESLDNKGRAAKDTVDKVLDFVRGLALPRGGKRENQGRRAP